MKRKLGERSSTKRAKIQSSNCFHKIMEYGVHISDERYIMTKDINTISKQIAADMLDTKLKEEFLISLQDSLDDIESFKLAMIPMERENSEKSFNNDSLLRLLLRIPVIAESITELLLEKLPVSEHPECNLAALIMSQLRWMLDVPGETVITKLTQVLPVCTLPVQKDIVSGLPEILTDEFHDEAAIFLLEHIQTHPDLVPTILEALSEMSLSDNVLNEVYEAVVGQMASLSGDSIPSALRFLLSTTDKDRAISSIRDNITFESLSLLDEGNVSEELSLECLEQMLRFHCDIQKTWLSHIQKTVKLTPFDFFVLLVIYRVSNRPKLVLAAIKSRLKSGALSSHLIREVYSRHGVTASRYNREVLLLCQSFMITHPNSDIPQSLYCNLFSIGDHQTKQEVVGCLISHIGSGASLEIDRSITTLNLIKDKTDKQLDRFASLLDGLIDYLNVLNIFQVREVMLLLVRVSSGGGSRIIDDIHIIVRKYLSHSDAKLNKLGVVGACALMEALDSEGSDEKSSELERFIVKVRKAVAASTTLTGLLYDELTDTVARLNERGVETCYKMFVDVFESTYIGDEPAPGRTTTDILCIEGAETLNENPYIAYNLWELIEGKAFEKVQLQWPLLRLVLKSCAASTSDQNLKDVDSLLGCFFRAYPLDAIERQYNGTLGLIAIINIIIELINGFCEVSNLPMRNKVIKRVINLTELLDALSHCSVPSNLLLASFDVDVCKSKNNKSSSSSKQVDNEDESPPTADPSRSSGVPSKVKPIKVSNYKRVITSYRENIREIDVRALNILNWNLPDTYCDSSEEKSALDIAQIVFLLEDLLSKCRFKLKPRAVFGKESSNVGFASLLKISEVRFVEEVVSLLPALCHILEENVSEPPPSPSSPDNSSKINSTDDDIREMETNPYKVKIFELVFSILETIFHWPGFGYNTQISLQCFDVLASRLDSHTQGPLSKRKKCALQYIMKYYYSCQNFSSVIAMLKCCQHICYESEPSLGLLAKQTLEKSWVITDDEKESKFKVNEAIGYLIEVYVTHTGDAAEDVLNDLVEVTVAVVETPKEPKKYPMFTKNSLPAIYKAVMVQVISYLQIMSKPGEEKLVVLDTAVALFGQMIALIKRVSSRPILRSALVYGQKFLEGFLTFGMPLLDKLMKTDHDEVQMLIKRLQACTRQLHHVTCHTKSNRDVALTSRVPLLKKFLETFVLKVKEMLAANNCTEAFWVGNLKQRNLKGEEIKSQLVGDDSDHGSESSKRSKENNDNDDGDDGTLSELSVSSDNESKDQIDAKVEGDSEDGSLSVCY